MAQKVMIDRETFHQIMRQVADWRECGTTQLPSGELKDWANRLARTSAARTSEPISIELID